MDQTAGSGAVAFVTTVHLALVLLRQNRSVRRLAEVPLLLPSLLLLATPWLLPAPVWLAVGVAAHVAWFVACERLLVRAPQAPAPVREDRPAAGAPDSQRVPSSGFAPAPVLAVVEETPDIRTFRVLRPAGFSFAPGQFLNVRVNVDGKPLVRCYSISSAPECAGYLEISVKRQGVVSNLLHATIRPGSVLTIKGAAGQFRYPDGDDRPLVLIGGGVGVTPLMSMLRHAVTGDPTRPVTLFLSVRTERDIPFHDELLSLRARHPQVGLCLRVSRAAAAPGIGTGRIDAECVRRHVADPSNSIFMVCGPLAMIADVKAMLRGLGARVADVRAEAFEAAVATAHDREELAPVVSIGPGPVRLTLAQSNRDIPVARGQSLLEACESAGVKLPSSCRAGVCLSCRTRLVAGRVECSSESLDAEDRGAGYILPCVSWPKSDCALDA